MAKELNSHFIQENIWIANEHMKRCSTLIRKIQIKITVRYQHAPISMATTTKQNQTKQKYQMLIRIQNNRNSLIH